MTDLRSKYPALESLEGERMVSSNDVADALGISRSAVYEAIHRGQLPCLRLRHRLLVPVPLLLDWLGVDSVQRPYAPSSHTCRRFK